MLTAGPISSRPAIRDSSITTAVHGHKIWSSPSKQVGTSLTIIYRQASSISSIVWKARNNRRRRIFMKQRFIKAALFATICSALFITQAMGHHSFAMYDQTKTVTLTGVMIRFVAQANHAE